MNIEELYESGERKLNRSHFRNLVMIAKADGSISPEEKKLLDKIGGHIGLSPEQVQGIMKNPQQFSSNTPYNREERFEQMINLVQMAHVNGEIGEKEMKVLERVAVGIGYRSLDDVDIESILALINRGEGTDVIMDELLR
jgi:uncharacterized tellurite resistance protein B-like protein